MRINTGEGDWPYLPRGEDRHWTAGQLWVQTGIRLGVIRMSTTGAEIHAAATDHLPFFLPGPDGSDPLMTFTIWFMVALIFIVGVLYLKLHALPEHMASSTKKLQMDIVAVLALIALFTHQNIFWLAALILAMIDFPDFGSPLKSMAGSLEKLADRMPPPPSADPAPEPPAALPTAPKTAVQEG